MVEETDRSNSCDSPTGRSDYSEKRRRKQQAELTTIYQITSTTTTSHPTKPSQKKDIDLLHALVGHPNWLAIEVSDAEQLQAKRQYAFYLSPKSM